MHLIKLSGNEFHNLEALNINYAAVYDVSNVACYCCNHSPLPLELLLQILKPTSASEMSYTPSIRRQVTTRSVIFLRDLRDNNDRLTDDKLGHEGIQFSS